MVVLCLLLIVSFGHLTWGVTLNVENDAMLLDEFGAALHSDVLSVGVHPKGWWVAWHLGRDVDFSGRW